MQAERAQAAIDELQRQISVAEEREAEQELEAQAREARQAAERLAEALIEIDGLADKVRPLFAEATQAAATVASWNRRVERAGKPDRRLAYVEPMAAKQRLAKAFQ